MAGIDITLKKAQQYCADRQLRFTEPRRHVLEILLNHKKPMGAYDILEQLGQYVTRPAPPTAYRAIDFWRDHGFVHKIESLNVFMACCENHIECCDDHADHTHDIQFLVCDDCSSVQELHHHVETDTHLPKGFIAKRQFTETHGTCAACS